MNSEKYMDFIEERLYTLQYRIIKRAKLNLQDLNVRSEDFYREMLNQIYGYNLINKNKCKQNFTSIDLQDDDNKILIQVTCTVTKEKINNTLIKDILKEYPDYTMYFVFIGEKAKSLIGKKYNNPHKINFNSKENIIDLDILIDKINSLDIKDLKKVYEVVKAYLGNEESSDKSVNFNYIKNKRPKRSEKYVERSIQKDIISEIINEDTHILIQGIGGIGKSCLLDEIHRFLFDKYDLIIKFNYDNDLMASFCNKMEVEKDERIIKYILSEKKNQRNLILIDNCNENYRSDKGRKILEENATIVITSRENIDLLEYSKFDLGDLEQSEAKQIFLNYFEDSQSLPKEKLDSFLYSIPKNTLLIEMIARAANESIIDINEFLEKVKNNKYDDLDVEVTYKGADDYKTIVEHLKNLYDFQSLSLVQKEILYIFTLFPEEGIPTELLDTFKIKHYHIRTLKKFGWIRKKGNLVSMHALIKECVALSEKITCGDSIQKVINYYSERSLFENIETNKHIRTHYHIIKEIITREILNEQHDVYIEYNYFMALSKLRKKEEVKEIIKKIKTYSNSNFKIKPEVLIDLYNLVGKYYDCINNLKEAYRWFSKCEEMIEMCENVDEQVLGCIYCNKGFTADNYREAISYLELSFKNYWIAYGYDNEFIAGVFMNMGYVEYKYKNYEKAFDYYYESKCIKEKINQFDYVYALDLMILAKLIYIINIQNLNSKLIDKIYNYLYKALEVFKDNYVILSDDNIIDFIVAWWHIFVVNNRIKESMELFNLLLELVEDKEVIYNLIYNICKFEMMKVLNYFSTYYGDDSEIFLYLKALI